MPTRRRCIAALRFAALVCCAAGLFAIFAGTAAAGGAAETFVDASGDSSAGADITAVTLSVSGGVLSVRIDIPNRGSALTDEEVDLKIDSNRDGSADYAIAWFESSVALFRWNGSSYESYPAPSFSGTVGSGVVRAQISLSDIDGPIIVDVVGQSFSTTTSALVDSAPNAGFFSFDTRGGQGADADGDGVPDAVDACLEVAGGRYDTNHNGCPGPFPKLEKPTLSFRGGRVTGGLKFTSVTLGDVPAGAKVVIKHGSRTQTTTKRGSGPLQIRILVGRVLPFNSIITITVTKPGSIGFSGKYKVKNDGIARTSAQCVPPGGGSPRACGGIDDGS
jgi:hypothetical protein